MYTICMRQVLDLNSGFEWFVQILIELSSKILNVKKVQSPETTMPDFIHKAI